MSTDGYLKIWANRKHGVYALDIARTNQIDRTAGGYLRNATVGNLLVYALTSGLKAFSPHAYNEMLKVRPNADKLSIRVQVPNKSTADMINHFVSYPESGRPSELAPWIWDELKPQLSRFHLTAVVIDEDKMSSLSAWAFHTLVEPWPTGSKIEPPRKVCVFAKRLPERSANV
jgi:hypothetical protein